MLELRVIVHWNAMGKLEKLVIMSYLIKEVRMEWVLNLIQSHKTYLIPPL